MSDKNGTGPLSGTSASTSAGEPRIHADARERDILNIEEAAELLGVSIKTFNKVLHSQDMPARKIGREWKFSRAALIDWVGSGRSSAFYRDTNGEEEEVVEAKSDARPRARRTAGWQIEMD